MQYEKAIAVIGLNYGDEGKGNLTANCARTLLGEYSEVAVVKHNGGSQAGHTVQNDNSRFVYSQVAAGSGLDDAFYTTYLAQTFILNPILLKAEVEAIKRLPDRDRPVVDVHPDCLISTTLDMLLNQCIENVRNHERHGSCGHGINETVTRSFLETSAFQYQHRITASHLISMTINEVQEFLERTYRLYWLPRASAYGEELLSMYASTVERTIDFKEEARIMLDTMLTSVDAIRFRPKAKALVFEGSQGMKLDEVDGQFPHVTRSRTGFTNVKMLCDQYDFPARDVVTVAATRAYTTRHGAGPLRGEDPRLSYKDDTNFQNQYQGSLRFSNEVHIRDELQQLIYQGVDNENLVLSISCLDQVDNVIFDGKEYAVNDTFLNTIARDYGIDRIMHSHGPKMLDTSTFDRKAR